MNERIRELAKQAGMGFGKPFKQTEDTLYIKSDKVDDAIATDAGTHQEQVLKFAELIVQECADIAKKEQEYNDSHSIHVNIDYCIKHHFGVE